MVSRCCSAQLKVTGSSYASGAQAAPSMLRDKKYTNKDAVIVTGKAMIAFFANDDGAAGLDSMVKDNIPPWRLGKLTTNL